MEVAECRQKMLTQNDVVRLVSSAEMMGYETEIVILFLVLVDWQVDWQVAVSAA
jgi:hypothetical protein